MQCHDLTRPAALACPRARRKFLKVASAGTVLMLAGPAVPAERALFLPPTRARGSSIRNVRYYGAIGDGRHDDTSAIQAAINSLPASGGTVRIPAGTYLIDTSRKINLRSLMHLRMDPDAILQAKPSTLPRQYVLYIANKTDVEISGGRVVGDRDTHVYATAGTHEWGHGLQILGGVRVTVRDVHVSRCTGDGVCIGGGSNDVAIANILSTANRRQGLSITNCSNVKVFDSEFSYTQGTAPECGIDVEPDPPQSTRNVWIEHCRVHHNAKYGVLVWNDASRVTVRGCTVEDNTSCGIVTHGCADIALTGNLIRNNRATGIFVQDGTAGCTIAGTTFFNNYCKLSNRDRVDFTLSGWNRSIERDILVQGSVTGIQVLTNFYR